MRIAKSSYLIFSFLLAASAFSQGVRYDNIALAPSGKPIAAPKVAVCTYPANTTTTPCSPLASIYSNQALTSTTLNPTTGDNYGNYGFWAVPSHYVVQVYGPGILTYTADVFLPHDYLSGNPVFDVKAFGAKGDGTTDDAPAIQLAVNAASGGGVIYFPAATYLVCSAIQSVGNNNLTFEGPGTIKLCPNANYTATSNNGTDGLGGHVMIQVTGGRNIHFDGGLVIDGNRANQTLACFNGIAAYGVTDLWVSDVTFQNVQRWPLFITSDGQTTPATGSSTYGHVRDVLVTNSGTPTSAAPCAISGGDGGGVALQNGVTNTNMQWFWLTNLSCSSSFMCIDMLPQGDGISHVRIAGFKASGSTGTSNQPGNIYIENSSTEHTDVQISDPDIVCGPAQAGIYAIKVSRLAITGGTISGCIRAIQLDAQQVGTDLNGSITGVDIDDSGGTGIWLDTLTSGTEEINIAENRIAGSGQAIVLDQVGGQQTVSFGENDFFESTTGVTTLAIGKIFGGWMHIFGQLTLAAGSGSFTFPVPTVSANCTANDSTAANAVKTVTSTTSATFTGTTTDTIIYHCEAY